MTAWGLACSRVMSSPPPSFPDLLVIANMKHSLHRLPSLALLSLLGLHTLASASGMQPDAPLLLMSQKTNTAQMGLTNTDDEPLLLLTTLVDVPGSKGAAVYALPAVTRVEPNRRQIVRFVIDDNEAPLKVQQLKRVRFEGIPTVKGGGTGKLTTTIRQDIPVIISPAGLEQDPAPWAKLQLRWTDQQLTLSNPSPFVVRLSQAVMLLPGNVSLNILPRTYILPGESFSVAVPGGIADSVKQLRLFPASLYGIDVPPFDAPLER